MKFTFKTEKITGRYSSFYEPVYIIKLKGKEVGRIESDKPYRIRFMVMKNDDITDSNPNCPWKWITVKQDFDSVDEAKSWIKDRVKAVTDKFQLHQI